jgi:hypothetical protein
MQMQLRGGQGARNSEAVALRKSPYVEPAANNMVLGIAKATDDSDDDSSTSGIFSWDNLFVIFLLVLLGLGVLVGIYFVVSTLL